MERMAWAAERAGANGIRANSVVDIQAIQYKVSLPIIGLLKIDYPDFDIYITSTMKEMRRIANTGVEVVACDVTGRKHPNNEKLADIVKQCVKSFPILF